jgi:hypothetical protein
VLLFKRRGGGVGERGGGVSGAVQHLEKGMGGGSVMRRNTWRRGCGVRPAGGVPTDSGLTVMRVGSVVLSEQGSVRGL